MANVDNIDPVDIDPVDGRVHRPGLFAAFRTRGPVTRPVVTTTPVSTTGPVVVEQPRGDERTAKAAYARGRRDERARLQGRARRRGAPLLTFVVLLIAAMGGTVIYLAVQQGSFTGAGQVLDTTVSHAAAPARSAADNAGNVLENAGQSLKQTAGSSQTPAQPPAPPPAN
jgi:hypothetical protein